MIILFYFIGLLLGACLGYSLDQYVKESRHINDIAQKHKNDAEYPYIIEENIEDESPVSEKFLRDCKKVAEKYKRDNGGWIPVEERLPEMEYDTVLCVTDRNYYVVAVYTREDGFRTMDISVYGEIIAWHPLPLYKPERSNNHDGK